MKDYTADTTLGEIIPEGVGCRIPSSCGSSYKWICPYAAFQYSSRSGFYECKLGYWSFKMDDPRPCGINLRLPMTRERHDALERVYDAAASLRGTIYAANWNEDEEYIHAAECDLWDALEAVERLDGGRK